MARETKAQRLAREQAEREARQAAEVAAYPAFLMSTLERVNNQWNMEVFVRDTFFVVRDRNDLDNEFLMSYAYSNDSQESLQELEWTLATLEEAQAEEKRRSEVRREAQRKAQEMFTAEERELLGL